MLTLTLTLNFFNFIFFNLKQETKSAKPKFSQSISHDYYLCSISLKLLLFSKSESCEAVQGRGPIKENLPL